MYIYILRNKVNSKCYIGQSIYYPKERFYAHKNSNSGCIALQNAITKYGWDNFESEVIHYPECSLEALNDLEQWYIIRENSLVPYGYNLKDGGQNGGKLSRESRQKMSASSKGQNKGNQYRLGKKHTLESKAKMSKASKGNQRLLGYKHTEISKQKMSDAHKGRQHSEESKRKISESKKGKKRSLETRRKISETLTGRKRKRNVSSLQISLFE